MKDINKNIAQFIYHMVKSEQTMKEFIASMDTLYKEMDNITNMINKPKPDIKTFTKQMTSFNENMSTFTKEINIFNHKTNVFTERMYQFIQQIDSPANIIYTSKLDRDVFDKMVKRFSYNMTIFTRNTSRFEV